jgi:DNA polymerase-3 subunit alpha
MARRDGDWVTVGGMITATKRIRTKKGDPMMFATLSDLDTAIELVVFGKALDASGEALTTDSIVVVRGRLDHKEGDRTCIVAQQIEGFEATEEEVHKAAELAAAKPVEPPALHVRLDATALSARALGELKELLAGFPGASDVVIELSTSIGHRRLKLGPEFRVQRSASLHAELDALLGSAIAAPGASESASAVSAA